MYSVNMRETGLRIYQLRVENGMSVEDLREKMEHVVSCQAIYKWQNGETLPEPANLFTLARIFHVGMEEILVMEGELQMEASHAA